MVPPHRRASGGLEPVGRALEPAGRVSEPAGRTLEPAGRALEPAGRVSEQARRALEPAGRALEPAERASEPAGRALEPAGRPGASWEGQLRGRGGTETEREKERKKEQSFTSMWWYHRSSSPMGPLPKKQKESIKTRLQGRRPFPISPQPPSASHKPAGPSIAHHHPFPASVPGLISFLPRRACRKRYSTVQGMSLNTEA